MDETEPQDVLGYMDYARRALKTAHLNFDDTDWVGTINRGYYAIFYAANAVLHLDGLESSKHSGVLAVFREKYVKTKIIDVEYSDIYGQTFDTRQEGDYEVTSRPSRSDAEKVVEGAERFVARIEAYLETRK